MIKLSSMVYVCLSTVAGGLLGGCSAADAGSTEAGFDDENVGQQTEALQLNGDFRLRNFKDAKICAGVQRGTPTPGTGIIPWPCDGSANQRWTQGQFIDPIPGFNTPPPGFSQLVNRVNTEPNRCLDGQHDARGLQGVIQGCASSAFQAWHLEDGFFADLSTEFGTRRLQCFRIRYGANSDRQVLAVERGDVRKDGGKVIHWTDLNPAALTRASDVTAPDQVWCADPN